MRETVNLREPVLATPVALSISAFLHFEGEGYMPLPFTSIRLADFCIGKCNLFIHQGDQDPGHCLKRIALDSVSPTRHTPQNSQLSASALSNPNRKSDISNPPPHTPANSSSSSKVPP